MAEQVGGLNTEKDQIALKELGAVIDRLRQIQKHGQTNIGHSQPICNETDIQIEQDHLDFVKKYIRPQL
jgi:hypothetical protein